MTEALLLLLCQIAFLFARTISVRYTANNHMIPTVVWSTIISGLWIVTAALGVKAVNEMDWLLLSMYFIGSIIGTYTAMKFQITNKANHD